MIIPGEIEHPFICYGCVWRNYNVLGQVKYYTYVKWKNCSGGTTWIGYVNIHNYLVIEHDTIDEILTGPRFIANNHLHPPMQN